MNTIQKPKRIIYPDKTNKCQHVTKQKYEADQQEFCDNSATSQLTAHYKCRH